MWKKPLILYLKEQFQLSIYTLNTNIVYKGAHKAGLSLIIRRKGSIISVCFSFWAKLEWWIFFPKLCLVTLMLNIEVCQCRLILALSILSILLVGGFTCSQTCNTKECQKKFGSQNINSLLPLLGLEKETVS